NLTVRAVGGGVVLTSRPEQMTGRWIDRGQPLLELGLPDSVEIRVALNGPGSTLVRPGQPLRLFFHADGARLETSIQSVAPASPGDSGSIEVRTALSVSSGVLAGRTGEASVTLRQSNVWGALWWGVRRRIRSDILL
ncbi:MAG: HlyD family secretion protein, partial [Gemmatimonadales bacterium]